MNNIKKDIYQIISNKFERSFFYDKYGESAGFTLISIERQIKDFEERYPEITKNLFNELRKSFPHAKIENFTHFFDQDRCIRFLVQITEELRFVCLISIFNFFSIYQRSAKRINDRYEYGELNFLNPDESDIANEIYNCIGSNSKNFIWLDKSILNEVIDDFSILSSDIRFRYEIKIADVLFTEHYL